jgi:hypothetical protein
MPKTLIKVPLFTSTWMRRHKCRSFVYLLLTVFLSTSACSSTRHFSDVPYAESEDCLHDLTNPSDRTFSTPFSDAVEQDQLEENYSTSSLRVAHALDVVSHLITLDSLDNLEEKSPESRLRRLEVHQQVTDRIQLASLEISGLAAALQCEQNRAYQVADFLRQKERRRERNRNVMSISVAALAAVIDASFIFLPSTRLDDFLSLGASAASVGISLSTLNHSATTTFKHPKNLLQEISQGPDEASLIPSSVWYYLTNPYFSLHDERSIREQLVRRWSQLQEVEENGDEDMAEDSKTKLIFSEGGVYTADELRMRAVMLEHTAAEVNLMQKNLQGLVRELIR